MPVDPVVLVLTHWFDPTADYVVAELHRRQVPVFRCDPGEFPQRLSLSATLDESGWSGVLRLPERQVRLQDVGCIYYRRPTGFEFDAAMDRQTRRWAAAEARIGFGGVLSAQPRWLNHPACISRCEYKPVQLAAARACGLDVPPTLITNNRGDAASFIAAHEPVVYKPLTPARVANGDDQRVVFTTPVRVEALDDSVTLTAHLFQAFVSDKAYDVRITVVDDVLLATRIDTRSEAGRFDWRRDQRATYRALPSVPDAIRGGVGALLRHFGLRFGAFDFAVTADGRWLFLEINPNGQWAFIEDATGQPISSAIADALQKETAAA